MTNQNVAASGAETFVHGTVLSVLFNTNVEKRGGGTYLGSTIFFQNNRGQAESQSWAQQIMDDARNIEIRNALIALQAAAGAAFTLHKVKNDKGYWNVTKIDMGHVEGVRTDGSGPALAPGGAPAPAAVGGDSSKMRSKEQCIRGEAVQAAATLAPADDNGQVSVERVISTADILVNYITNGTSAPVAAPVPEAAPAAAPAPVVAPVVAAPVVAAPTGPAAVVGTVAPPAAAPVVVAPPAAPVAVPPATLPTIAPAITAPVVEAPDAAPAAAIATQAPAPAPAAIPPGAPVATAPPVAIAPVVAQPAASGFQDGF